MTRFRAEEKAAWLEVQKKAENYLTVFYQCDILPIMLNASPALDRSLSSPIRRNAQDRFLVRLRRGFGNGFCPCGLFERIYGSGWEGI
jgi:hypothetical protein